MSPNIGPRVEINSEFSKMKQDDAIISKLIS